ncbi:MAG: caspase family protein [Pseudomonadota bacterium]
MHLDKAIIIIAVSQYSGGSFAALPGALTSARRMRAWAEAGGDYQNYTTLYITDEDGEAVTVQRLKEEIIPFLEENYVDRLIVYFAGHGLVRSAGDQFWLLTDASEDPGEGVHLEVFRRKLISFGFGRHNPSLRRGQVCIISDACRNVTSDSMDFDGNPIVTRIPQHEEQNALFDRFFATSLGEKAFQINAQHGQDPYCLFTEILIEALEGRAQAAIETEHHELSPAVISWKICQFLEDEVPNRARDLHIDNMRPDCTSETRPPSNVYFRPEPTPAHTPPAVAGQTGGSAAIQAAMSTNAEETGWPGLGIDERRTILNRGREKLGSLAWHQSDTPTRGRGLTTKDYTFHIPEIRLPDFGVFGESLARRPLPGTGKTLRFPLPTITRRPPTSIEEIVKETGAGSRPAAICDFAPEEVYAPRASDVRQDKAGDVFVLVASGLRGNPLVIKHGDSWILTPDYPKVVPALFKDISGDVLLYLTLRSDWDTFLSDFSNLDAETVLRASDATKFADKARVEKERYPHYAVTAGYLYELANDYDNIARTAHYMAKSSYHPAGEFDVEFSGPIVPFDLALLCASRIIWEPTPKPLRATADLPAVEEFDGETERPRYATVSFDARTNVPLWGGIPIYQSGWTFLRWTDTLDVPKAILDICPHVRGRSATNLTEKGLQRFLAAYDYEAVTL